MLLQVLHSLGIQPLWLLQISRPRLSQQVGDTAARLQEAALAQTSPQRVERLGVRQKASSGSSGRSASGAGPGMSTENVLVHCTKSALVLQGAQSLLVVQKQLCRFSLMLVPASTVHIQVSSDNSAIIYSPYR